VTSHRRRNAKCEMVIDAISERQSGGDLRDLTPRLWTDSKATKQHCTTMRLDSASVSSARSVTVQISTTKSLMTVQRCAVFQEYYLERQHKDSTRDYAETHRSHFSLFKKRLMM
jgi:hypothetical protein